MVAPRPFENTMLHEMGPPPHAMTILLLVAVACLPLFFTGDTSPDGRGGLFLGCYVAYTAYLIPGSIQHDALSTFSVVMEASFVPLTVVTLAVLSVRARRGEETSRGDSSD